MFKQLTTVMLAVSLNAQAAEFEGVYGYVGAGYKVDEHTWNDQPFGRNPTARFGIYGKWGKVKAGIDHHSQWRDGWPTDNNNVEYHKTELFVDFEICLFLCRGNK